MKKWHIIRTITVKEHYIIDADTRQEAIDKSYEDDPVRIEKIANKSTVKNWITFT